MRLASIILWGRIVTVTAVYARDGLIYPHGHCPGGECMQKAVSRSMWYRHWEARNSVATNTASATTKVDLSCDRSIRSVADSESKYASDVDIVNQL